MRRSLWIKTRSASISKLFSKDSISSDNGSLQEAFDYLSFYVKHFQVFSALLRSVKNKISEKHKVEST